MKVLKYLGLQQKDITEMRISDYFIKYNDGSVMCTLCPHQCTLKNHQYGICKVRVNLNGILYSDNYSRVSSMNLDPVEKKPLYHFFPGKKILSVGSVGCNLSCRFCQNYEISQRGTREYKYLHEVKIDKIINEALSVKDNCGIAFTYNEPVVGIEFVKDVSVNAHQKGLKTAMITNGFINEAPLKDLFGLIDAFNVDLKSFKNDFYEKYSGGTIEPVKRALKLISESNSHLEITNLIIPTLNDNTDDFEEMVSWIKINLGEHIPFHISGYYPRYQLDLKPTSIDDLSKLYRIASNYLKYVYIGNVYSDFGKNTICPACQKNLITREGYIVINDGIDKNGNCGSCGKNIIIPEYYES